LAELIQQHQEGDAPIGILGLTYKPDTDVVEEAFGLLLAQELAAANQRVIVYDPSADISKALGTQKNVRAANWASDCVTQCGVIVLATPWQEFRKVPNDVWSSSKPGTERTVIDCWRSLNHLDGLQGVRYVRLGFGGRPAGALKRSSAAD